jgi:hypothetical protein
MDTGAEAGTERGVTDAVDLDSVPRPRAGGRVRWVVAEVVNGDIVPADEGSGCGADCCELIAMMIATTPPAAATRASTYARPR